MIKKFSVLCLRIFRNIFLYLQKFFLRKFTKFFFFSKAWCVRSQVGEDVDVVYWESFMNDQGRPELSSLEVHLRNTLRLPGRPLWHALQAGTCERDIKIGEWKK